MKSIKKSWAHGCRSPRSPEILKSNGLPLTSLGTTAETKDASVQRGVSVGMFLELFFFEAAVTSPTVVVLCKIGAKSEDF